MAPIPVPDTNTKSEAIVWTPINELNHSIQAQITPAINSEATKDFRLVENIAQPSICSNFLRKK